MKQILYSLVLFLFCCGTVAAQQKTIKGVVKNDNGNVLIGANVLVVGTTNGTTTDANGNFKLILNKGSDSLRISYLGYYNKTVSILHKSFIKIILTPKAVELSKIVAIGYGTEKKANITGSIAVFKMSDVEDRPITNIGNALSGQLAGVRVKAVDGGLPGSALSIQVRGIGSITGGTEPLYVVDGIPLSGGLKNISTNDIESIEVLKDASSAAIYGSRASNGVVLITTKRGKEGGPIINLNAEIGVQQLLKTYTVLNRDQWIDFALEERQNTYLLNGGDPNVPFDDRPGFTRIDPKWISDPKSFPDNNWADIIYRNAFFQHYHLSVSGGDEKTKYYFGGGYLDQDGLMINSGYKRYSLVTNIKSQVNRRIEIGLRLNANIASSTNPDAENRGGPISRASFVAPIVKLDENTGATGSNPYIAGFLINPYQWAKQVTNPKNYTRILSSIFAQINIINGLKFKSTVSTGIKRSKSNYFMTSSINRNRGSIGEFSTDYEINLLSNNILTYKNTFGKNHINAIAGFTAQRIDAQSTSSSATGFPNESVRTLNAATQIKSSESFNTGSRLLSYLARIVYGYNHKYLFTASIRRDGSSKFGHNHRWGWFPSISGGWIISNEKFMKTDFINNLKLRISYGITGNNSFSNDFPAIGRLSQANYILGSGLGNKVIGLKPSSLSNPDLTWEKGKSTNLGVDIGILNNRFSASIDLYNRLTDGLLLNVPIPQITGFSNAFQNVGKVNNRGIELELRTHILTERLKWNINGNIAYNKNMVKELGPENTPIPGIARGTEVTMTKVGYPIGSYYLIPAIGIFQTQKEVDNSPNSGVDNPGDIKFKDSNGDGKIDDKDREIVGHNNPDFIWGATNTLQYKNFHLSIFFQGSWGNNLVSTSMGGQGESRGNVLAIYLNRWKSPEDPGNGKVPRAAITDDLGTPSTFWMFNASYWKIQNITLGYSFPDQILQRIKGVSDLDIYLSIENVASFDHYYGVPQTGAQYNSPLLPGIDAMNTYPLARTITFGLNLSFK